ncbi:uncharacterized protein LOC108045179 [Drosophila rhopaloa]|uniref:Uncharacterized protein LOC108045179 n=1 Tax=Drosophila rhopaloa TaxID=1041015 RepID=A0A6P4ENZ6_DRORH|nr:uncharacterized protein LOC108045179 [Drosophila rhopaloa]
MADNKHQMLYQGQDPGQDLQAQRPLSLTPSEPPTYDDAMAVPSILTNLGYSADRRRTFFPEPQQLRLCLEEVPYVEDGYEMPQLEDSPGEEEISRVMTSPQVRHFFALAPQPKLGSQAVDIVCPACGERGTTRLRRSPHARTNIWALWLCTFGWCCCACFCPYFWNGCRSTNHYCSACEIFLGAQYPAGGWRR